MMKRGIRLPKPLVPLFPVPVVLVTCGDMKRADIITVGWVGVVSSSPPQIGVSIRPERYSYELIEEFKEFVVNIPCVEMLNEIELCGRVSGKNTDKFELSQLTAIRSAKVAAPSIRECPVNVECVCEESHDLGSHTLFIGKVLATRANEAVLNHKNQIDFSKIKLLCINLWDYWTLGKKVGEVNKICRGTL